MFVTPAYAQAAGGAAGAPSALGMFAPLVLVMAIMYLLVIRPQQRKLKEQQAMINAVRRGDQVVTAGGILGKVTKVAEGNEIEVEIATGVKVRVLKSTLSTVLSKGEPATAE